MNGLKLGKRPAQRDERDLRLARYLSVATGPTPPTRFGFDAFVAKAGWGMLGNDEAGDCVWAGAAHEHMVFTGGLHGTAAAFTTQVVLGDYAACTGFTPGDPATDQGTDPRQAAGYRRQTGILDATGQRHQIGAYVWLTPGNWDELVMALYVFEAVGIGVEFPDSAFKQFDAGESWDVVAGAKVVGGHYIAGVGRSSADTAQVVTWGSRIGMTRAFYEKYNDETLVYLTVDQLRSNLLSLRGFSVATLTSDLAAL